MVTSISEVNYNWTNAASTRATVKEPVNHGLPAASAHSEDVPEIATRLPIADCEMSSPKRHATCIMNG